MSGQSIKASILESVVHVASGYVVALLIFGRDDFTAAGHMTILGLAFIGFARHFIVRRLADWMTTRNRLTEFEIEARMRQLGRAVEEHIAQDKHFEQAQRKAA